LNNGIVIAGFSGIGKTELEKKYKNVIDLDAAEYIYDDTEIMHIPFEQRKGMNRKKNPNFPKNYIDAIKDAKIKYDLVLVWDRQDIITEYIKNNIDFILCYPDEKDIITYKIRYKNRGNTDEYIKWKLNQYYEKIPFFNKLCIKKIILSNNETLEDYLINNNFNLIKK